MAAERDQVACARPVSESVVADRGSCGSEFGMCGGRRAENLRGDPRPAFDLGCLVLNRGRTPHVSSLC